MAGTTISSALTVGVTLTSAAQNPVTVTASGKISVTGAYYYAIYAYAGIVGTIANSGTLTAADGSGIRLRWGGTVTNGSTTNTTALISGGMYGVRFDVHGTGTLTNFATVSSSGGVGVFANDAAKVTNGAANDISALISGYSIGVADHARGTVTSFGTIAATGTAGTGIYLRAGGLVTNGSAADRTASITGGQVGVNILHAAGTVMNFGTIAGTGTSGRGVVLGGGGSVTNGSSADTTALINAAGTGGGIYIRAGSGTVVNFGTVLSGSNAVTMDPGGTVTNGSVTDTAALLSGTRHGVYLQGNIASSVSNFGTISAAQLSSVIIYDGPGSVTNGAAGDTKALIDGGTWGVYLGFGGTITNFGTITGLLENAVYLAYGGTITNGSPTDTSASISIVATDPRSAIFAYAGTPTITNFGTVSSATGEAINFASGGAVTNGSAADRAASLTGASTASGIIAGVELGGTSGTVTNFGTITGIYFDPGTLGTVVNAGKIISTGGATGPAIVFGVAGNNRLVVDPGAGIVGKVTGVGGTGTLELAAGTGTSGGIGSQITGFGTLAVDTGGAWTLTGANTIPTLDNLGTVVVGAAASLNVTGSITVDSTGLFDLANTSTLTIAADPGTADAMKFIGAGTLVIGNALQFGTGVGLATYAGPLIENFGVGDKIDFANILASTATLTYTVATGLLQVTSGATSLATLDFQTSSLGAGSFQKGADTNGHLVVMHS